MPPVVAAAAAVLVDIGVGAATATTIATIGVGIAAAEGVEAVSDLLRKGSTGGIQTQTAIDPTRQRSLLLGKVYTGGSAMAPPLIHDHLPTGGGDNGQNRVAEILIDVGDHFCDGFEEIQVNGNTVSLGAWDAKLGYPVLNSVDPVTGLAATDYTGKIWIQFHSGYDGQPADAWLMEALGDRWPSTSVATNVCYFRCTCVYDAKVLSSFPTFNFVVRGAQLYDPSQDSSVGGSGAQRWGQPLTYAWSDNPAVLAYNVARGITVGGKRFYGMFADSDEVPLDATLAAISACNETVFKKDGTSEPRYRAGCEIMVSQDARTTLRGLVAAMAGRMATGGQVLFYAGVAQTPVFSFNDNDILANTPINFDPKQDIDTLKNSIMATYLEPAQQWSMISAPPRFSNDDIAEDGGFPLVDNYQFDQIQSGTQCQRVMEIIRERARAQGGVPLTFGPAALNARVGQWVQGTSAKWDGALMNFEIISRTINPSNLNVMLTLKEAPAISWDAATDELTVFGGSLPSADPPAALSPSGVTVTALSELGADGSSVPRIKVQFSDPNDSSVTGAVAEAKAFPDDALSLVGITTDVATGLVTISNQLLAETEYQVRLLLQGPPGRASAWSDWFTVTTPASALPTATQDQLDGNTANISAEAQARANTDAAVRAIQQDVADVSETLLSMQVLQAAMQQEGSSALAYAVQTITKQVVDGQSAEAQARLDLAAVVSGLIGADDTIGLAARITVLEDTTADLATEKANASDLTALNSQVNTPGTGLAAQVATLNSTVAGLDPDNAVASLGQQAIAIRTNTQNIADLSETLLGALAALADTQQSFSGALAFYRNEITSTVNNGLNASVEALSELGAELVLADQNLQANITDESDARVAADNVLASRATTLEALLQGLTGTGAVDAAISEEASARATADAALTTITTGLSSALSGLTGAGAVQAAINTEATTRASADTALATTTTALSAALSGLTGAGAVQAAITTEAGTRASADSALTATTTTLSAALSGLTGAGAVQAALNSEASTRAAADSALTTTTNTLVAQMSGMPSSTGSVQAAINSEATARAAADSALTTTTTTLSAALSGLTASGAVQAAINNEATARAAADSANASNISTVSSQIGAVTASGYFQVQTQTTPSDALARIALMVSATSGGSPSTAALYLDALSGGASRAILLASQVFIANGSDAASLANALEFVGGTLYLKNAAIQSGAIGTANVQVGAAISMNGMSTWQGAGAWIMNGTVSNLFGPNARVAVDYDPNGKAFINFSGSFTRAGGHSPTVELNLYRYSGLGSGSDTLLATSYSGGSGVAACQPFGISFCDTAPHNATGVGAAYYILANVDDGSNTTVNNGSMTVLMGKKSS